MRQILFHIPLDRPWNLGPVGDVAGFGFGLVLILWILFGLWSVFLRGNPADWKKRLIDDWSWPVTWVVMAIFIVYGAPELGRYLRVHGSPPFRNGVPIFGYGLMLFYCHRLE